MEKILAHGKNEMHDEYFKVVKAKLDEIVEFVNSLMDSADDTAVDFEDEEPDGD